MIPAALTVLLLALPPAGGAATTSAISPRCQEALAAQDEVVSLLDQQVAELKAALEERKVEVAALKGMIASYEREAAGYKKLWLIEQEAAAADRRRAWWGEKMGVVKYGALGLAAGVLVDRFAE